MTQHVETAAPAQPTADPTTSTVDRVRVVLGPKTRLGRALLRRAQSTGTATAAVGRQAGDLDGEDLGTATQLDAGATGPLLDGVRPRSLQVLVCALGPVHPGTPRTEADSAGVLRDLATVRRLLETPGVRDVHVVLVSTVIALAPGADRRHYGGWKGVVEQELGVLVDRHPHARMSVLYPGRLLDRADRTRPWHRMHTTYDRLAALVERAADGPGSTRVVGLDARAWLLARGASVAASALSGSRRRGQVLLVDDESAEESWGDR